MSAGYYRVDVNDTISVLSLSDEYMDLDDDQSMHGDEANEQLDWLETQLINASGRKFIIAGHVYAGARYHGNDQWHADDTSRYF